eukprot:TRINITY_DN2230_c0_g1_i10.p1 TRINITY_DN2230_c0_g1~~TRINITY_DN2230_c0_g1_i10.p1  ORF type:complete len:308 (-),score=20.29 TRINITY_DN2230_c0_g1_i10:1135-2058(-)
MLAYHEQPWWGNANGKPAIIAHRAGCGEAPENTIAALKHSLKAGASIISIQVRNTKDGIPIIAQMDGLYRLIGEDKNISELTFDEIPPLADKIIPYVDITAEIDTTSYDQEGREIPTFKSFLYAFVEADPEKKAALLVEPFQADPKLLARIAFDINTVGISDRVILGNTMKSPIIDLCVDAFPDNMILLSIPQILMLGIMYFFGLLSADKVPKNRAIVCSYKIKRQAEMVNPWPLGWRLFYILMVFLLSLFVYRKRFIDFVQKNGCPVSFFILNDEEDWIAVQKLGVRAIMTDYPDKCNQFITRTQL